MKPLYDNPLPTGWNEKPLAQVVQLRRGYTWTKEDETDRPEEGAVPVIRIPNIQDRLELGNLVYLRNISLEALEKAAVTKGWLLFIGSNGSQDRIGDSVLMEEDRAMVFASFLMGMTVKDQEELIPEFLASWMRIHLVHEWFSKTSQQTTGLGNYSWGAVKKLPLRSPADPDEQRRIAAALKLADEAIAKAKAELEATLELKRSLLRSLFAEGLSHPQGLHCSKWITCPSHWTIKPLRHFAKVTSGFTMGRDLSRHETETVPYVTVVNVQDGRFELSNISSIEIKKEELNTDLLQYGDILMTEGGDRDKLGRGGMWRKEIVPCSYQNHIFRVRLDADEFKPELFHFLIQTYQAKNYFYAHAKQTSNLCTINSRELKNWPVAIPPMPEQEKMVKALQAAEKQEIAVSGKVEALQQVKKSLLQNLLTGKIRIPEGAIHG
ncbi:restriction endonuclease subunit S [Desulfobulbus alkaliphilus]|uniref:restriction endonuclease subunit S n=1 Tax=Desulfobulbus alkaliphilus TaxID=869814 RepID=UPI001963152F|nr:restriction endonuclease subunit S [Desulfobulbus alkaliphilus]MBM9535698.1 restriction endonuclease subunit S [Desulfobulbus alkaliphilus]